MATTKPASVSSALLDSPPLRPGFQKRDMARTYIDVSDHDHIIAEEDREHVGK